MTILFIVSYDVFVLFFTTKKSCSIKKLFLIQPPSKRSLTKFKVSKTPVFKIKCHLNTVFHRTDVFALFLAFFNVKLVIIN